MSQQQSRAFVQKFPTGHLQSVVNTIPTATRCLIKVLIHHY